MQQKQQKGCIRITLISHLGYPINVVNPVEVLVELLSVDGFRPQEAGEEAEEAADVDKADGDVVDDEEAVELERRGRPPLPPPREEGDRREVDDEDGERGGVHEGEGDVGVARGRGGAEEVGPGGDHGHVAMGWTK